MIIGDVVFLNSNPEVLMTVQYVLGMEPKGPQEKVLNSQMKMGGYVDGDVYCTWFDGKNLKNGVFKAKMLTKK